MQAMNKVPGGEGRRGKSFDFNKDTRTADAKAKLDDIAQQTSGMDRYVIELQGFTDKSGSPIFTTRF